MLENENIVFLLPLVYLGAVAYMVLVGAASSKHIKICISYCMNLYLTSYLLCIGFKKMFRKLLNRTQTFFCLFYWSYGLCTTSHAFCRFSTLSHKVNEA